MSYKTPTPAQQEVAVAVQDFFADKKDKAFRQATSGHATKLAWSLKKLVGEVRSEDLDETFAANPSAKAFNAFVERVVAVEKALPANKKPLMDVGPLTTEEHLAKLEQAVRQSAPAPSVDR